MNDQERFEEAKRKIIGGGDGLFASDRLRPTIGTLSEKTVHAVLKNYIEPDEDCHEIPIGKHVADIYRKIPESEKKYFPGGDHHEIIEIQTRSMYRMREKLRAFLPQYPVTIVHPIPHVKKLFWVDEETGELSGGRTSPKKGTYYHAFSELYGIREYLQDPNLRIRLMLLDMREYKLLNGFGKDKKIRATRYDRIPEAVFDEMLLSCPEDYMQLVPADLPEEFTSADFAKCVKLCREEGTQILQILREMHVIEKTGKKGNSFLYRCTY